MILKNLREAYGELKVNAKNNYDEKSVIQQFVDVLDQIKLKCVEANETDIYQKSMEEILRYWSLKNYQTSIRCTELKEWNEKLQEQNEDRIQGITDIQGLGRKFTEKQNEERNERYRSIQGLG